MAQIPGEVSKGFAGCEVDRVHLSQGCRRNREKVWRVRGQRKPLQRQAGVLCADGEYPWMLQHHKVALILLAVVCRAGCLHELSAVYD